MHNLTFLLKKKGSKLTYPAPLSLNNDTHNEKQCMHEVSKKIC